MGMGMGMRALTTTDMITLTHRLFSLTITTAQETMDTTTSMATVMVTGKRMSEVHS